MKLNLKITTNPIYVFGRLCRDAGLALFFLTFWWTHGVVLGGDPTFLGGFRPELEVIFPWCGVGVFLVFYGLFLMREQKTIAWKSFLFLLFFLAFGALSAVFSFDPKTSVLYLLLWATGFLSLAFGDTFRLKGYIYLWLAIGLALGSAIYWLFPLSGQVSIFLLGLGGLWGILSLSQEQKFPYKKALLLWYTWVVFQSGSIGLIFFLFLLFFSSPTWLPRSIRKTHSLLFPFLFLSALSVWGWREGLLDFSWHWGFIQGFWTVPSHWVFGVGEGQYLVALQRGAEVLLGDEYLRLPGSVFLLRLQETGLVGIFFLLGLFSFVFRAPARKKSLGIGLLLLFSYLISPALLTLENGILFFCVLLFIGQEKERVEKI